jgi:hypothetical protein
MPKHILFTRVYEKYVQTLRVREDMIYVLVVITDMLQFM